MEIKNKIKYVLVFSIGVLAGMTTIKHFLSKENKSAPIPESRIDKHDVGFYLFSDSLKQRVLNGYDAEAYRKLKVLSYEENFTLHANDINLLPPRKLSYLLRFSFVFIMLFLRLSFALKRDIDESYTKEKRKRSERKAILKVHFF